MALIRINEAISIDERDLEERFIRASGPGGQNVNKLASAVQLRFYVRGASNLPEEVRERLLLEGFVRIDARGLLEPDRYALTDQVLSVSEDRVVLNVTKAELIPVP